MLNLESKVIVNNTIETMDIDNEKAMIDLDTGKYYTLNETATVIWDCINNNCSVGDVVDKLISIYEIEIDECIENVNLFLEELEGNGLLKIG